MLTVSNVSKRFGGLDALTDVSLTLARNTTTGLIGPNGAGKTTLFNVISGFLAPDAGSVLLDGEPLGARRRGAMPAGRMARSFQDVRIFENLSLLENVMTHFPAGASDAAWTGMLRRRRMRRDEATGKRRATELLDEVGLAGDHDRSAGDIAYGEQKLLAIARLLATGAEVILLDEPLSGLDPDSVEQMIALIKALRDQHDKTICIVEHNLDVIRAVADQVVFLDHGRVLTHGTAAAVFADPRLGELYVGGAV